MKREHIAEIVTCAALALCYVQPWAVVVAAAGLFAQIAFAHIEARGAVKESRIAALEESFDKLKATAAAVVKVEARTSALERGVAAALRLDHD